MEKSKIATTIEQSIRMVRNGIDPLSADMYYEIDGNLFISRDPYDLEVAVKYRHLTPAWSFSKLFDTAALNRSEFVELENSADYIEFLVGQVIEERKGREKMKECLKRKNDN